MAGPVIIYGASSIGFRIAEFLRHAGTPVTVIVGPEHGDAAAKLAARGIATDCRDVKDPGTLDVLDLRSARSIVLSSENELFNLQAALHAVERNPDIRVVIRLFNLNLARKLEESVRNFKVLSVSQVASPSFTAASLLDDNLLSFEANRTIFSIFRCPGERFAGRTVRETERDGGIRVVAVGDELFPDGGRAIGGSDRVTLFASCGRARSIAGIGPAPSAPQAGTERRWSFRRMLRPLIRQDRILLTALLAVLCIAVLGILMVRIEEHLSFFDAVYVILATMTSGGFEDTAFRDFHPVTKTLFLLLMVSGVTLVAFLFAVVTDAVLKKRLDILMGRRRQRQSGHVILCGVGDVGVRILEDLLVLGEKVVAIEKNAEGRFVQSVSQMNVPLIMADATLEETLLNANVRKARSIICATDDDIRNLEIGLNARSLNPHIRVVLRIFEQEFAEKVERHFDIHTALSSSGIAAPSFASAATDLGVINTFRINGRELAVRDLRGAGWSGREGAVLAVAGADGEVRPGRQAPRDGERAIVLEALPPRGEEERHAL